jgi:hypothetical protein
MLEQSWWWGLSDCHSPFGSFSNVGAILVVGLSDYHSPFGSFSMLEQSWWWAFRTATLPLGASPMLEVLIGVFVFFMSYCTLNPG